MGTLRSGATAGYRIFSGFEIVSLRRRASSWNVFPTILQLLLMQRSHVCASRQYHLAHGSGRSCYPEWRQLSEFSRTKVVLAYISIAIDVPITHPVDVEFSKKGGLDFRIARLLLNCCVERLILHRFGCPCLLSADATCASWRKPVSAYTDGDKTVAAAAWDVICEPFRRSVSRCMLCVNRRQVRTSKK